MFDSLLYEGKVDAALQILELPNPPGCAKKSYAALKENLLSCTMRICHEEATWKIEYRMSKPALHCLPLAKVCSVVFTHSLRDGESLSNSGKDDRIMVYHILGDWTALIKLNQQAEQVDDILDGRLTLSLCESC